MKIEIKNYTKTIKDSTVLDNINITFESGRIYGLKGKNGSGKTMLMRAVCGLIKPTSGQVVIENEVLGKDISFPRSIGVLIENPSFLASETGFSNLRMLADLGEGVSDKDIEDTLLELGLNPKEKKSYKKYSLGMKQKLGIAAAVMEHPDIIILDEPINALDQDSVEAVKNMIIRERDRGAVIILACHDTEELEYLADEIICIQDGKIIS